MIASHLALAGFQIAEKTVRSIKREKFVAPAVAPLPNPPRPPNPVVANFVHHVWMMDVTEFKTLFGARTLYFAAAVDAFSRLPLTGMTFNAKPGGAAMARLFRQAVTVFGPPQYLITDLGGEFIAGVFKRVVVRPGAKQRFAAADNIRATARLERFWKTLKAIARARLLPPLDLADLEQRLSHALAYYAIHRPHSSLAHRTPAQAFIGAAASPLIRPPRGRRGECSSSPALRIGFVPSSCGELGVLSQTPRSATPTRNRRLPSAGGLRNGVHPTLDLLGRRSRSADQEEADSRPGRLRRRSNSQFRGTRAQKRKRALKPVPVFTAAVGPFDGRPPTGSGTG